MRPDRRDAILKLLFGAGGIGLRALATGVPASILLDPRRALAATVAPRDVPDGGGAAR